MRLLDALPPQVVGDCFTTYLSIEYAHHAPKIINVGYLENGLMMFVLESGNDIVGEYLALVEENKYTCDVIEAYPRRLYCYGQSLQPGSVVEAMVFLFEVDALVFEGELVVPVIPTEKPKPTNAPILPPPPPAPSHPRPE